MKRLWLVLNPGSGSTSTAIVAEFAAVCAAYDVVGRTDFPAGPLPDAAALDAAGADTLVVFGGDGTINAATCAVDDWGGVALILPGGTMNGLARALHGTATWREILDRAAGAPAGPVPVATCAEHRAMVGVIMGPAASWFHAREYVRSGAWSKVMRALRFAARKTFARTIRVVGEGPHAGRHRAVIVTPRADGLEIAAISTASWLAGARLGLEWLTGDWRRGHDVHLSHAAAVTVASSRKITALFDGEPTNLPSPATVRQAMTRLRFVATRPRAEGMP
jgi:diacylglycerol kinase family enzyme